jgi:Ni/Co efflux regulator RcnB
MKRFFFALALMATIGLGGLAIESASAQNTNSDNRMDRHRENDMRSMRGRHHRRGGHHRRHRREGRGTGNANM